MADGWSVNVKTPELVLTSAEAVTVFVVVLTRLT